MNIEIARVEDESKIKNLLVKTPGVWQASWRENAVRLAIESAGNFALIANESSEIVGFACLHDCGFRAYLSELVVSEQHQNKSIGQALVSKAEEMLIENGCQLIVTDAYPPAENFYKKLGWGNPQSKLISKFLIEK